MTIEICLLVWNILSIGNILLMRYILLLSSINFGTKISKRLLLRWPDGHWGSRHYTVRLFILCGYIFSEYVMNRKNSKCNQCDFSSHRARVLSRHIKHGKIAKLPWYHNFGLSWYCQWGHAVGHAVAHGVYRDIVHDVIGQVMQSIEGLKTQSSFHARAA